MNTATPMLALAATLCGLTGLAQAQSADRVAEAMNLSDVEVTQLALAGSPGLPAMAEIEIDGALRTILLDPSSPRSATKFRQLVQLADGSYEERAPEPAVTYRGTIAEMPGAKVAAGWLDDGLHAMVLLPDGGDLWIEPLLTRVEGADLSSYAVYSSDDVLASGKRCGVDSDLEQFASHAGTFGQSNGGQTAQAGGLLIAELGVDTDFEYFQDYGSTTATQNRIDTVINTVNMQYESEISVTHQITTTIIRTTSADPYSSTNPGNLLDQFRNHWNSQQQGIQRDVAHLFTGKNIQGGVIGVAYLGVICSNNYGYGLAQSDCCGSFASTTDLSAHELGHNWNADHCSCSGPNYTMNSFLTSANRFHPTQTIPAMINYANGRPCLTSGPGGSLCDVTAYGAGVSPGNIGSLSSTVDPEIGQTWSAIFTGFNGPASGLFIASNNAGSVPFGSATILVDLATQVVSLPIFAAVTGTGAVAVPVPDNAALVGANVFVQVGILDGSFSSGYALSNGLELTFCD